MRRWKLASLTAITLLLGVYGALKAAQMQAPSSQPAAATIMPAVKNPVDQDIRDIRPPIHIPYGWLWAAYVAGGLALAGLGVGTWRWLRRRSHQKLLYELTLEQLEAARALMQSLKGYEFSIAVSEIIRRYIEQRFNIRVTPHTTQEFLHELVKQSNTALKEHQPLLADFLEHCDLAKFARWHLSIAQMEAMYKSACAFVTATGTQPALSTPTSVVPEIPHILTEPRLI
jgi:hypothetical protein